MVGLDIEVYIRSGSSILVVEPGTPSRWSEARHLFSTSLYWTPYRGKCTIELVEMMAIRQRASRVGRLFSTPRAFVEAIRIDQDNENDANAGLFGSWSNKDLDPSPPSQRVWTWWSFFVFQFSIAFSPTTYNVGASLFAIGLSWWTILISSSRSSFTLPWRLLIQETNHEPVIVSFMIAALLWLNSRGASRYVTTVYLIKSLMPVLTNCPRRYHVGFPTFVRVSSGIYGSLIFVFFRGVCYRMPHQILGYI